MAFCPCMSTQNKYTLKTQLLLFPHSVLWVNVLFTTGVSSWDVSCYTIFLTPRVGSLPGSSKEDSWRVSKLLDLKIPASCLPMHSAPFLPLRLWHSHWRPENTEDRRPENLSPYSSWHNDPHFGLWGSVTPVCRDNGPYSFNPLRVYATGPCPLPPDVSDQRPWGKSWYISIPRQETPM